MLIQTQDQDLMSFRPDSSQKLMNLYTMVKRHFGIAGPWAWTLDPEMLDSGPIFRPKNIQNLVHYIYHFGLVCFRPKNFGFKRQVQTLQPILCVFGPIFPEISVQSPAFPGPKSRPRVQRFQNANIYMPLLHFQHEGSNLKSR